MKTNIPARLVVLVSGNGSNLQAILDACASGYLPANVSAVISNKSDAYALQRAAQAGVAARVFPKHKEQDRHEYDALLADWVTSYQPDWIVLAGWMRLLSSAFLNRFPNRVVNLHPALPGTFPGVNAIERAHEAFLKGEITQTGVMVHFVPDEGVDNGPVIATEIISLKSDETLEELETRVHQTEHRLLIDTLKSLIEDKERK
jgi:phosphoribosylglycinamide formyltransferase 1